MAENDTDRRRYSDQEINAIIERAVRIQQSGRRGEEDELFGRSGVSLRSLKQLAAEAGLDAAVIEQAAAELDAAAVTGEKSYFWGGPTSFKLERIIEGEVPEERWDELAEEIYEDLHDPKAPVRVGDLLECRDAISRVRVRSKDGQTRVAISSNYGGTNPGCPSLFAIFAFLTVVILAMPQAGMPGVMKAVLSMVAIGGGYLGVRALVSSEYRKARKKLSELLERLTSKIVEMQETETSASALDRVRASQTDADDDIIETRTT